MGFPQALSETRAIQAEVPTNLVGNLSHCLCWKVFPQSLSEGYTINNLASWPLVRWCILTPEKYLLQILDETPLSKSK